MAVRTVNIQQPLLEGFIDRQVHTAMMARNLSIAWSLNSVGVYRSLLYPEIDIGPFPAYYMLEFPAYPLCAATLATVARLDLDLSGRLLSVLAIALACALLYDLVRQYDRASVAILAAAIMALLPVTIRYGRSFQPDATMISLVVSAVWFMDRWSRSAKWSHLMGAALATTMALLLKVIAAYVLIPLGYLAWRKYGWSMWRRWELWAALCLSTLPSAFWYVHSYQIAAGMNTVSTPFWQLHKWFSPTVLLQESTYRELAYYLGIRVLTPLGLFLATVGVLVRVPGEPSKLFHVWLASLTTYFPILVRKLDHEHYYLAIAPLAAVFIARALCLLYSAPLSSRLHLNGKCIAVGLGWALVITNLLASKSTFTIPDEWRHVPEAAHAARNCTSPDTLLAGHSAVLFYANRRGFSMAYKPHEIAYLFGTWSEKKSRMKPFELLDFYRRQGADYYVELLGTVRELDNLRLFEQIRHRYNVVEEVPGKYVVVSLRPAKDM